jgi:hypothetical protein
MLVRRLSLALSAFLLGSTLIHADILVLKNGDRKEGTIVSESPTAVRMKYRLTPKIWDEKDFPRADVAEVIRQRPSELAMQEQKLRELLPTQDMMSADDYERIIQDRLRPFVNQFPGTPEATEVEQIIKDLQAEKEKVVSGQLKVDGKWLTETDVKRDDYNIRANRLRNEIKATAASQRFEDWVAALRVYDRFIDPASSFVASTHYPLLVPEVIEILTNYEAVLLRMIREQPGLFKAQEESVARLIEPDLTRTKGAIQQRLDAWKAQYDAEKRARARWLIPYKLDLPSLTEAHKTVVAERAKLQTLDLEALTKQNELLVTVFRYLADENVAEAETALAKAKEAIGNSRDYSQMLQQLTGKINTLKTEIQRKKTAQRTAAPGAPGTTGGTGPIMDDRVAKALAEAANPAAAPADPNAPPAAGSPAAPGSTPAAGAAKPAPAPAAPRPASAPVVEEEGFPMIILIGGGALLALLITVMVIQKKKKKSED